MHDETVAEAVAAELSISGVDRVFGLPGGEVLYLMDALRDQGVEYVLCRHESYAGIIAAVYGKLQGKAGVALTTLGPGASNLLFPIANSLLDREPLVAISADVPSDWPPARTHQRLPLMNVFNPVTKWANAIDAFNCRSAVRTAIAHATAEPQGPVFLTLAAPDARATALESPQVQPARRPESRLEDPSVAARRLRSRLDASERPMVLVGLGVTPDISEPLRSWLNSWNLPVAVTPKAKGMVDERSPNFVGVIGGMSIDATMLQALDRSDLLIGFGLDPSEIDGAWHTQLPIIWVLDSPWATGKSPLESVIGCDHARVLSEIGQNPPHEWDDFVDDVRKARREVITGAEGAPDSRLTPLTVLAAMVEALPASTILTTDVGAHKYVFGQFWPAAEPSTFWMSNGLSGMGYGLPAAIGAKLARPSQKVVTVLGDGGFSMNSQELETARRIGAHVIVVVLADNSYTLIRAGQQARQLQRFGVDFSAIDNVGIARACGVDGVCVRTRSELAQALTNAVEQPRTSVIEVPLDPNDYAGLT